MKNTLLLCIAMLALHHFSVRAQERPREFLSFEAGLNTLTAKINSLDNIRSDVSSPYDFDQASGSVTSLMSEQFFGLKYSNNFWKEDFGLTAGFRYTRNLSTAGKETYFSNASSFFYLLYKEEGLDTRYLKVKEIRQRISQVGIPLEFRYYPRHSERVRFYLFYGVQADMVIASTTELVFVNEGMEKYQASASAMIEEPEGMSLRCFAGIGFNFRNENTWNWGFEAGLPVVSLNTAHPGLNKATAGSGFQIYFQIPLKRSTHEN